MRNAPSVTYPVGRCAFYGWVLVLVSGLAALTLALCGWLYPVRLQGAIPAGVLAWLSWSALALWSWHLQPVGQLQWDAEAVPLHSERRGVWRWAARDAAPGELQKVQWVLDAPMVSLLRIQAKGQRPLWIWLRARSGHARWIDLRRALAANV